MKTLLASLFATLTLAIGVSEGEELFNTFVPQAAETTARASLTAIADNARSLALLEGGSDLTPYVEQSYANALRKDGLSLNGSVVEWSDTKHCWRLIVSTVWEAEQIVSCS